MSRQLTALAFMVGYEDIAATLAQDLWVARNPEEYDYTWPNWPEAGWGLAAGYETDCLTTAVALRALKAVGWAGGLLVQSRSVAAGATHTYGFSLPHDVTTVLIRVRAYGSAVRLRATTGSPPSTSDPYWTCSWSDLTLPDASHPVAPGLNYISVESTSSATTYTVHVSYETPGWDSRWLWDPIGYAENTGEGYGPMGYLVQAQNPDGGWGLQRGQPSELYTTLHVLLALDDYAHYDLSAQRSAGINYLRSQQLPDGSFGYEGVPLPYVTALAALALVRSETYPFQSSTNNAIAALLAMQDEDGSWEQEPYDTALAVLAMWEHNQTPVVEAGPDQLLYDTNPGASEEVTLNALASDVDGTIDNYTWTEAGVEIAAGPSATLTLPRGIHTITLTVTDNGGKTASDSLTVTVAGLPRRFYFASMDADPGWSAEGLWGWGIPAGAGGSHGGPDPISGFTGPRVYGYNLSGGYENDLAPNYLTTGPIDCTNYARVQLRVRKWLCIGASDHASLQVTDDATDPSRWTTVYSVQGSTLLENVWSLQSYDLSSTADALPAVHLRWVMGPTDGSITYGGWNIDDVELVGCPLVDMPFVPGDLDGDLDVDSNDFGIFESCATGPALGPVPAGCEGVDFDGDADIDQDDLGRFQRCYGGSNQPSPCAQL